MIYNKSKAAQHRKTELIKSLQATIRDTAYLCNRLFNESKGIGGESYSCSVALYNQSCYSLKLIVSLEEAENFINSTYQLPNSGSIPKQG